MSLLSIIEQFVQQVVEAIAAVLEVEVMVIDDQFQLLAATGRLEGEIGVKYNRGSLTEQLMLSGEYHVVEDPRNYAGCRKCQRKAECSHLAVLIYPLVKGEKIIGSLSLAATNLEQKKRLLDNQQHLLKFTEKISALLSRAAHDKQISDHYSLISKQFRAVMNSVHEGIIATDAGGIITHCNRSAEKLLQVTQDKIIGSHIKNIFSDFPINSYMKSGVTREHELYKKMGSKSKHFWSIITPIKGDNLISGLTVSFRSMVDIRKVASSLMGYQSMFSFDQIIGRNPAWLDVIERLKRAAKTDSTILIRGESGTGKELLVRAVHSESFRRNGPFVAVNCGAIPETLLESELFGYEEGAFTGAKRGGKPGKFELANGGTLFLDEIGDMPLHLQVKLLRVIEQHSFDRVGGTEQIMVDARIIVATHRNLEEMMEKKEFRQDLYYRLSVIPITVPSLRERGEDDIKLLLEHFIKIFNDKMSKKITGCSPEVMEKFLSYRWPGNVRELENAVEYAISMESRQLIHLKNLPTRILGANTADFKERISSRVDDVEKEAIAEALRKFGNTVEGKEKAAKYLGISIATLYRKLKKQE